MDCKQIDELLVDYLYEEIDPAQVAPLEAHLEACERCAAEVASFKQTRLAVSELEELDPPARISQALLAEAARAAPRSTFSGRLRSLMRVFVMHPALAAAATLVAVLGVSFYTYRQGLPPARYDRRSDLPLGLDHQGTIRSARETRPAPAAAPEGSRLAKQRFGDRELPGGAKDEQAKGGRGGAVATAAGGLAKNAPTDRFAGRSDETARRANEEDSSRSDKSGLRSSGPVTLGYGQGRGYMSDRGEAERQQKVLTPPAQAAVPAGANVDDLKRIDTARAHPSPAPRPTMVAKARKKRPATTTRSRRPSPRRRAARRLANAADVGGGSGGVWSNKSPARGRVAQPQSKSAKKQDRDALAGGKAAPAKEGKKSVSLLALGDAAVRQGRCRDALEVYLRLLASRPDLTEVVAARLAPCQGKLGGQQGYRVVAKRAAERRAKRRSKAKRARRKATQKKAAPAADAYAK